MRLIYKYIIPLILPLITFGSANAVSADSIPVNQSNEDCPFVVALNCNECINCYYGVREVLQKLDSNGTLFILSGIPKREVPYFFELKLGLNADSFQWVVDDSLFKNYTNSFSNQSTIFYYQNEKLAYSSDFRNMDLEFLQKLIPADSLFAKSEQWDITAFGGDANSTISFLNDDTLLVYNAVRNKIYLYSLHNKIKVGVFEPPVNADNLEDWLLDTELNMEDINFSKKNRSASEYINSLNRIQLGSPFVTENFVYLPVELLAYDIEISGNADTTVMLKWFSYLAKYDKQLHYISKYAFTYQIVGYPNHFNYTSNGEFLDDSTFIMKPSTRLRDSIIAFYRLTNGDKKLLFQFPEIAYPNRFPMKVGAYSKVYYSDFITSDMYYFKEEPILYNLSTKDTIELKDWKYTKIGDSTRTGFWVETVIILDDTYYIFCITNGSTYVKTYDKWFNVKETQLLSDAPFFSIVYKDKKIYGLISDEESIIIQSFILNK